MHYVIGTSGYSFRDWLGPFYPTRTKSGEMFGYYARTFPTVEINYSYYRMPSARTLDRLTRISPPGFDFWVKAFGGFTHERDRSGVGAFREALAPVAEAGKLAGVLLQFPQGFHRTIANRRYLGQLTDDFGEVPLAVEFRHASWQHPSTLAGLRERRLSLVVPDVPSIPALYHSGARATTRCGYLRLHSRNAANWYDAGDDRYDYNYSDEELRQLMAEWDELSDEVDRVYVFFNNCHSGQAAANAVAMQKLLATVTEESLAGESDGES